MATPRPALPPRPSAALAPGTSALWHPAGPGWARGTQRAAVVVCGLGVLLTGTLLAMLLRGG